jgi:GMP synthase-like glutamine amidotransferase
VRVLSIVHHDPTDGGVFDETAERLGHTVERWLPPHENGHATSSGFDAIMIFGGAMHPDQDDDHPWLAGEVEFIRDALDAGVPLLGVCLGAQLLARAAGGDVGPADASEVGWHEVELTDAGHADPVLSTLPARIDAFQWHHYTYALPATATELARSERARQAFTIGQRAWGIQFHAEVTREMIASWAVEGADQLAGTPADLLAQTDGLIDAWNDAGRRLCTAFLESAR